MFERFTEKARRAVFFARYEASQYGNQHIGSEHLLLGLLREDRVLAKWFPGERDVEPAIRAEIERQIPRGEKLSTSLEIPLTVECRKILQLALEESKKLGNQQVGTEHLFLGLLELEGSLAARLLQARGVKPEPIRVQLTYALSLQTIKMVRNKNGFVTLESFLAGLKGHTEKQLAAFFADNAQFIDASGKRWNREELCKSFAIFFATYAKKNAAYKIEAALPETGDVLVAAVLWKNAMLASEQRAWKHRMTVVLIPEGDDWRILSVQVTVVQPA